MSQEADFDQWLIPQLKRMRSLIDEVHESVNKARAERGLPPWDFSQPRRQRRETGAARMKRADTIEGLRGEIVRARKARKLNLTKAAAQIGAGVKICHLSEIESGALEATAHELVVIRFWLDLNL